MAGYDDLWLPREVLSFYPPDRHGLRDLARAEVSDELLLMIAGLDYGTEEDMVNSLDDLRARQSGSDEPVKGWGAGGDLNLFLLTQPKGRWLGIGRRSFHVAKVFAACEILPRPTLSESVFGDPYGRTLPTLLHSCRALGQQYLERLAGLLTWALRHIGSNHRDHLTELFAFVAVAVAGAAPNDSRLGMLAQWLDRLSEEYDFDTFLGTLKFGEDFNADGTRWCIPAVGSIADHLPPESELGYELAQLRNRLE